MHIFIGKCVVCCNFCQLMFLQGLFENIRKELDWNSFQLAVKRKVLEVKITLPHMITKVRMVNSKSYVYMKGKVSLLLLEELV